MYKTGPEGTTPAPVLAKPFVQMGMTLVTSPRGLPADDASVMRE
jgi:hypothetical protein